MPKVWLKAFCTLDGQVAAVMFWGEIFREVELKNQGWWLLLYMLQKTLNKIKKSVMYNVWFISRQFHYAYWARNASPLAPSTIIRANLKLRWVNGPKKISTTCFSELLRVAREILLSQFTFRAVGFDSVVLSCIWYVISSDQTRRLFGLVSHLAGICQFWYYSLQHTALLHWFT